MTTTDDLRRPLARRQLIRRLIATGEIHSQEQVVDELARRGIRVTQATVSRDFAELGVVRGIRNGSPVYLATDDHPTSRDPGAADRLRRLLLDLPLTIDETAPLLVGVHVEETAFRLGADGCHHRYRAGRDDPLEDSWVGACDRPHLPECGVAAPDLEQCGVHAGEPDGGAPDGGERGDEPGVHESGEDRHGDVERGHVGHAEPVVHPRFEAQPPAPVRDVVSSAMDEHRPRRRDTRDHREGIGVATGDPADLDRHRALVGGPHDGRHVRYSLLIAT
jgi:hypothetical protein